MGVDIRNRGRRLSSIAALGGNVTTKIHAVVDTKFNAISSGCESGPRERQVVVGKLARPFRRAPEIKIGKIFSNFDQQSSSELNGSSPIKRQTPMLRRGDYDDALLFSSCV
jgi:hypothetical protein